MFFDNLFYVSKATVNSYQPYSRPFFSPPLPCHLPSSSLTPLPHLLVWLCDTLSLTCVACVTLGLDVCIGTRCAHHWVHSCRQWPCLPLKPAVSSCSSGRPRAWSPSWVDTWLLTGLVLWGPSVGNHGCWEIIFAMAVLCSEDNSLQPFPYIFSPVVFLPHLCPQIFHIGRKSYKANLIIISTLKIDSKFSKTVSIVLFQERTICWDVVKGRQKNVTW